MPALKFLTQKSPHRTMPKGHGGKKKTEMSREEGDRQSQMADEEERNPFVRSGRVERFSERSPALQPSVQVPPNAEMSGEEDDCFVETSAAGETIADMEADCSPIRNNS